MIAPLKSASEFLLVRGGPAAIARAARRNHALVLAYHNVAPDGAEPCGERSLHLPFRDFVAQVELLARTCEVVPLDSLLDPPAPGRTRPRVALTFDDAYRGAATAGVDELARRGLPATFFVVPGLVGSRGFWWDRFADPATGALPRGLRERALSELRGDGDVVAAWAAERGIAAHPLPAHVEAATEDELRRATASPGITLAPHSWSHRNLAALAPAELAREMEAPLHWLRARFDAAIPWLAYPYGLSSPAVERAAREAGYRGALRVEGGWLAGHPRNPFLIPRFNVPAGISLHGFEARAAGVL